MTTPELAPPSLKFHIRPTGGHLSHGSFNEQRPPVHIGSSTVLGFNSRNASPDSVTLTTRLPRTLPLEWCGN
ncbi:hypothetical protein TNCV_2604981 [Trichonephila clavipes]|nr:hypothetical protein TNCV_2604981 [Trichonephila clavipes]